MLDLGNGNRCQKAGSTSQICWVVQRRPAPKPSQMRWLALQARFAGQLAYKDMRRLAAILFCLSLFREERSPARQRLRVLPDYR